MLQIVFRKCKTWPAVQKCGWDSVEYKERKRCSLIQASFLSPSPATDSTQGLPDRPVAGEDAEDPGRHQGQVPALPVQPALQDPPPVAHVPVCRHAPRRPQLAVPQHHSRPGAGCRRGTVNSPCSPPHPPQPPPHLQTLGAPASL